MSELPAPTVMHADLDAFYASVEQRDDPTLAGVPVIVGGTGPRAVVATCSYQARLFGVRSAMPMSRALALCPDATVVAPRMDAYRQVSAQVFAVFDEVADVVEAVSVDEAYLDVTGAVGDDPGPLAAQQLAGHVRDQVRSRTDLAISVGLAPTKTAAKLASEAAKPDGLRVVTAAEVRDFLAGHDTGDIPGIGPATAGALADVGITTVAQLAVADPATLARTLGVRRATGLVELARGVDPRPVTERGPRKQVGAERTFDRDLARPADLQAALADVVARLHERVRTGRRAGRTVTVKVRFADFTTVTRAHTLDHATDDPVAIGSCASWLLDAARLPAPVRLLGVSLSNLVGEEVTDVGGQLRLFDPVAAPPVPPAAPAAPAPASGPAPVRVSHPQLGSGTVVGRDGSRTRVQFDRLSAGALDVGTSTLTFQTPKAS